MGNINFEDFYKVPELSFDITKLRKDLETVLMKKKFDIKDLNKILSSFKKNIKTNSNISEILDSIEMLDLISKLEKEYKIKINSKDINYENFSSTLKILNILKKNAKTK